MSMVEHSFRKGIDYTGVTSGIWAFNDEGKFLMIKRSIGARDEHGRWDLVGGSMEFDESPEEMARREMKEEVNCDIKNLEFIGINDVHRMQNNIATHWICLLFKGNIDKNQVKIMEPEKIEEFGWFTLENPPPLHSMYLQAYEIAKHRFSIVEEIKNERRNW